MENIHNHPPLYSMTDQELVVLPDLEVKEELVVEEEKTAEQWGQILPVTTSLLPVELMKPDMLPESVRPWLLDVSYRMNAPLDYGAAPFIVMLSSLIGTRLAEKPNQRDDWTVVPNLWVTLGQRRLHP